MLIFNEPLVFIKDYVHQLDDSIKEHDSGNGLSFFQKAWLSFCIMAIFITNSVCWAKFERAGMGQYTLEALSYMFRKSKIPWDILLERSTMMILKKFGITEGILALDDTDRERSKSTKRISNTQKIKDKKSGGYINGQNIIFLLLVTPMISIIVGFTFYKTDPELVAWRNMQKNRKKKKSAQKKKLPKKPGKNPKYPTKLELALVILEGFKKSHPNILIKVILADALYGTKNFMDKASKIFGGIQVISQIRRNQNILFRNKKMSVEKYFFKYPGVPKKIKVRGSKEVNVIVGSARLYVDSHKIKRFVIALKYEGEEDYRYIIASDLSWRTLDIVQAYTLRWLIEVFIQDWKSYEGWGQLAKQPDEEGSSRSLILSLLLDHCLFFHPLQLEQLMNGQPAYTVGSLRDRVRMESLLEVIREILADKEPKKKLLVVANTLENLVKLAPSKKHMNNIDLGRLEPTEALKYRSINA